MSFFSKWFKASANSQKTPPAIIIDPDIEFDPMFQQAVDIVLEVGKASPHVLQKGLRIGFVRCCTLLDQMEAVGIVGPADGTNHRKILSSKKYWESIRFQCSNKLPF